MHGGIDGPIIVSIVPSARRIWSALSLIWSETGVVVDKF
uniref:Uncharacterized protein n=1 Tax=Setaria italica TaxID=4555 RepID=K4APC2_SETIT